MTTRYGKFVPSRNSSTLLSHRFCILIDITINNDLLELIADMCTLRDYLNEIKDSPAILEIHCTSKVDKELAKKFALKVASTENNENNSLNLLSSVVEQLDSDLVLSEDIGSDEVTKFEAEHRLINPSLKDVKSEIEIFVRGHDVPWSFETPFWNLSWEAFYPACDKIGKDANELYLKLNFQSSLNAKTKEVVRSLLLNRFANISYSRDKLLFFVQQRRFVKRHGIENQNFRFECSFFSTFYYLLLWGGLEQMSSIIDSILKLKNGRIGRNVANERFRNKILLKDKELGNFILQEELLNWYEQLQTNRHFVAHEGNIMLSDLMEVPDSKMSDSDLEKAADSHPSWSFIKHYLPESAQQSFRDMIKQQILIASYKRKSDSVMVIHEGKKQFMFSPLVNVQWDFNNFKLVTFGVLEHLLKKVSSAQ